MSGRNDVMPSLLELNNLEKPKEFGGQIDWNKLFTKEKVSADEIQKLIAVDKNAEAQKIERRKKNTDEWLARIITQDDRMLALKETVKKLSIVNDTVLILGETGTGKELIAKALDGSRTGKFIPINCGGFPEYLVDSILFGHKKGAFTGADSDSIGAFQAAHNGTVFLDEIGDLPLHMQVKLLRFLQDKTITPVGSNAVYQLNTRVVCATNRDLKKAVTDGSFREDLWWRISTFIVQTIPLRDRYKDVLLYLEHCKIPIPTLLDPEWKGNYRELQQYVRRIQVLGT